MVKVYTHLSGPVLSTAQLPLGVLMCPSGLEKVWTKKLGLCTHMLTHTHVCAHAHVSTHTLFGFLLKK